MRSFAQLLYGLSRLALLALTVSFISFWLLSKWGLDFVEPVGKYGTKYVPVLLLPVSAAMVLIILLRWAAVNKKESVSFGDFLAFLIAAAFQAATVIVYRAQGNEIAGGLASNIPDVEELTTAAEPYGMLAVAGLQFGAFFFYWIADPDPKDD